MKNILNEKETFSRCRKLMYHHAIDIILNSIDLSIVSTRLSLCIYLDLVLERRSILVTNKHYYIKEE
jgi:hypothetical protein